jgi:hypothetical protein
MWIFLSPNCNNYLKLVLLHVSQHALLGAGGDGGLGSSSSSAASTSSSSCVRSKLIPAQ